MSGRACGWSRTDGFLRKRSTHNFRRAARGALFPKGPGTEDLFFEPDANDFRPRLITQQADGRWIALKPDYRVVNLPGDGSVSVAPDAGGILLRMIRPNEAADDAFYADSKAFMDLALKALDLRRSVGPDQVSVTSLGSAQTDTIFVDAFGRKWQKKPEKPEKG